MANAQAGDRFVVFMLRTVWTSLKLGFLAGNLSLYHVNHVARPREKPCLAGNLSLYHLNHVARPQERNQRTFEDEEKAMLDIKTSSLRLSFK